MNTLKQTSKLKKIKKYKLQALKILCGIIFMTLFYMFMSEIPLYFSSTSSLDPNESDHVFDFDQEPPTLSHLTLVNRWNPIPDNFEVNLIEVPGGEKVDVKIYEPLMKMLEAAKASNWNQMPIVVSGYRTKEQQERLYENKVREFKKQGLSENDAKESAKKWVAVPNSSEHQLGLAVDINGAVYDVFLWLQENSYKYGFIFRYPGNKTELTGTAEEVWHYRYVGTEAAKEIYEQGLCLEEYLTKKNLKD